MNHAVPVTLRAFGRCIRSTGAIWPQPSQLLFRAFHTSRNSCSTATFTGVNAACPGHSIKATLLTRPRECLSRQIYHSRKAKFSTSTVFRLLKPYPEADEPGLKFRKEDLTISELRSVFPDITISQGEAHRGQDTLNELDLEDYNRLLRVLHARRVDGMIDIPTTDPALLYILETFPDTQEAALAWLRHTYPIDEDDAILARFRREEAPRQQESPSVLTERGQKLGLLKMQDASTAEYYGPQSGAYYAELSEKGADDVFGRSELERIRAENEARRERDDEEWQKRVDESMEAAEAKAAAARAARIKKPEETRNTALQKQSSKEVELAGEEKQVRPPNALEKWIIQSQERATTDLTLESPEIANMTMFQRLFPSFLFVLVGCIGCYIYAQTWEPPRRSDRWLPDVSMSIATCVGILGANFMVFLLWRFPPARSMLNKYFLVSPAYPYAASTLGNVFSHWSFNHFFMNMFGLFIFGPALHEELGRGNFIGLYVAAGLLGSFGSLTSFAIRKVLTTTSQGASGSIWAIMSAYLWLHKDDNFSFIFVPKEYQSSFTAQGWMLLVPLVLWDILGSRSKAIDVVAHQVGMLVGVGTSQLWRNEHPHKKKPAQFGFLHRLFGGGSAK